MRRKGLYKEIGEEDGLGDIREGEIREEESLSLCQILWNFLPGYLAH